jgi:FdhD protein
MRTPGHYFELAAGFLVTEGLVRSAEITAAAYCDAVGTPDGRYNTVTVHRSRPWSPKGPARQTAASTSCGICGKAGIDQVELSCPVVGAAGPVPASLISLLPERLRRSQQVFERTGGWHAGLFDPTGQAVVHPGGRGAGTTPWARWPVTPYLVVKAAPHQEPVGCSWCLGGSASKLCKRRPFAASG